MRENGAPAISLRVLRALWRSAFRPAGRRRTTAGGMQAMRVFQFAFTGAAMQNISYSVLGPTLFFRDDVDIVPYAGCFDYRGTSVENVAPERFHA